jgi:hypothetical protein
MKHSGPAVAALALALLAGCDVSGGQGGGRVVAAVDVIQRLRDAGYQCDPNQGPGLIPIPNNTPKVFYACGQAQVFTIYDDTQRMGEQSLAVNKLFGSEGQLGGEVFEDPNNPNSVYPFWDLMCMDDECKAAAHKAGWSS